MKNTNRTIIYSLTGQSNQKEEQQIKELRLFAQSLDLRVVDEFVDNFIPCTEENRTQLKLVIEAARNREFDCLLVWQLDYFACSLLHLCEILREFASLQIRFISLRDNMNLKGKTILTAIHVIETMIDFKSTLLNQQIRKGMAKAKKEGRIISRPKTPSSIVKLIEELAANTSYSINKIRLLTGDAISYGTASKIIKNIRDKPHFD